MKISKNRRIFFEDYFDSVYSRTNLLTVKEYENTSDTYHAHFGNFLPADKLAQILDIGCGTGHFLFFLKKSGYKNLFGIDLSKENIDFCKRNITPHVKVADAFRFLLKKRNHYSVISAHAVLEHIPKNKTIPFLKLIYNALKTEGILLLTIPNMSNPFSIQMRYRDFTHECGYTEHSIYQVLYLASFRDIRINSSWHDKKSIKYFIRKKILKKFYWFLGGYNAPDILSSLLIVMAKK